MGQGPQQQHIFPSINFFRDFEGKLTGGKGLVDQNMNNHWCAHIISTGISSLGTGGTKQDLAHKQEGLLRSN